MQEVALPQDTEANPVPFERLRGEAKWRGEPPETATEVGGAPVAVVAVAGDNVEAGGAAFDPPQPARVRASAAQVDNPTAVAPRTGVTTARRDPS